ncbi:Fe-S cluster assembly protein NifU, partial [bacterium]|nr:Fe-S cluster assembly protein NifU [bacterium]
LDHFTNPRNVGEIHDANAVGEVGSLACGDALKLFLKIDPKNEVILDAKFKTFGCASAIASSSALTEMIKGRTLSEAQKISNFDIALFLGGLPEQKMHCSVMGREALEAAVANFRGLPFEKQDHEDSPVVCNCFGVTEAKIRQNIKENELTSVEKVTYYTKAGGGCGGCVPKIQEILAEILDEQATTQRRISEKPKMTNIQRIAAIQKVVSDYIAPALASDGGNIELIDVEGTKVFVKLSGTCKNCTSSQFTLKSFVQEKLREYVSKDLVVIEEK